MSCRWWTALILLPAIAVAATPGEVPGQHWWGVVVGVGQYEHLDESLALDGPPNDVPLIVTWLRRQGVPRQHLTVLADQVSHVDGLPTRAAILESLRSLPEKMTAGDIAVLYFAGHGSLQPQGGSAWSKADGLDEIFLPRDVGRWDGPSGQVAGAITGFEIGRAVEALRSRGIFVWLIFDSCHSATIARALLIPHVRFRAVAPAQLGVPVVSTPGTGRDVRVSPLVKLKEARFAGGYVAFYAAQTVDSAPEMPLPAGELRSQVHGLFTYALLKALGATGSGSYREVAHRILAYYASTYPETTPEFEGALDGPIGAPGAALLTPNAWPAQHSGRGFIINSGRLNGITPHSLLALYAAVPGSRNATPLGLLVVSKVTLSDAWAQAIEDPEQLSAWKIPANRSATVATGIVRVLQTSVDTTVRFAGPAACFPSLPAPYGCNGAGAKPADPALLELAHRIVNKSDCLPVGAEPTANIAAADIFLMVRDGRLVVAQSGTSSLNLAAAIDLESPNAFVDLQNILFKASRSVALLRLAADFPETPGEVVAELRAREGTRRWLPIGEPGSVPIALGAELSLQLQNVDPIDDLDVTILALDDHFGITPVYPVDQESNLLRKGSARTEISGWARTPGETRLVLIIEKSRAGRPHDLGYLAQPGVSRNATSTGLAALLERIGFSAPGTRSSLLEDERQESSMRILRYQVTNGS